MTPLVYVEALNGWFEADCQVPYPDRSQLCGRPAVVHRPSRAVVRHVCAGHAEPAELRRANANQTPNRARRLELPMTGITSPIDDDTETVEEVHCYHPDRHSDEDDWDLDDDLCVHCECCCTCLGCEYGPRDGMLMFPGGAS